MRSARPCAPARWDRPAGVAVARSWSTAGWSTSRSNPSATHRSASALVGAARQPRMADRPRSVPSSRARWCRSRSSRATRCWPAAAPGRGGDEDAERAPGAAGRGHLAGRGRGRPDHRRRRHHAGHRMSPSDERRRGRHSPIGPPAKPPIRDGTAGARPSGPRRSRAPPSGANPSRPRRGSSSATCTRRRTRRGSTRPAISVAPGSTRSPGASSRPCTGAGSGRCASTPASHRRGDQPALPLPARAGTDRAVGRLRPADPDGLRLRCPRRGGRGRPGRCPDLQPGRHGRPPRWAAARARSARR